MVAASYANALLSLGGVMAIFALFAWVGEQIDRWEDERSAGRGRGAGNGNPTTPNGQEKHRREPRQAGTTRRAA